MSTWYKIENGVATPYIPTTENLRAVENASVLWKSEHRWERVLKIATALTAFAVLACVMGAPPPFIAFAVFTAGFSQSYCNSDGNRDVPALIKRGLLDGIVAGTVYGICSLLTGRVSPII